MRVAANPWNARQKEGTSRKPLENIEKLQEWCLKTQGEDVESVSEKKILFLFESVSLLPLATMVILPPTPCNIWPVIKARQ